ncbi:MAG TPA: hypothetical protein VFH48_45540 [Chloroflexota bacterium]|nr:hypothetical protein [Chloroflexota bacterium]
MADSGLFGSVILEVAVGLFFVYLLLSLICSSINEIFASLFKLRARNLEQGLRNLICDEMTFSKVTAHPLIKAMGNTRTDAKVVELAAGKDYSGKPSYIPSRVFALALLDSMMPERGQEITVAALREKTTTLIGTDDARARQIGEAVNALISASRDPTRVAQRLDDVKQMIAQLSAASDPDQEKKLKELAAIVSPARRVGEIKMAVEEILPEGDVRTRVLSIVDGVEQQLSDVEYQLDTLHRNVAQWYEDAMDRVSGTYKRKTQTALFVIGLVVSVFLGVDSVRIVTNLSVNPTLRAAIVETADRQTGPGGAFAPGGAAQGQAPAAGGQPSSTPGAGTPSPSIGELVNQLNTFSALFGYSDMPTRDAPEWSNWLIWRILGTAMTVFAVSMGAPFWFDVLNKVANLRGVGKRPDPIADPNATPAPAAPVAVAVTSAG